MSVRLRFAPSPTGFIHVGSLRTALFNYLFARKHEGKFILRIEDTDQSRFVEGAIENLLSIFDWLGISFDEGPHTGGNFGPYVQSERLDIYRRHIERLVAAKQAYHCFCTPGELEEMRAAQVARGETPMYDRRCRNLDAETARRRIEKGDPYVVRLTVPLEGNVSFSDLVRGDISFQADMIDDQVLLKSDGFPTYHLANVVDDHQMRITHVIRGEEWLTSTPKHILLYQYFGWEIPKFAHLPLLLNADRTKLSKRSADVSVESYRAEGILPEALLNFVALLGWHPTGDREFFSLEELVEEFDMERVRKSGSVFDMTKLRWFNSEYLKKKPDDEYFERVHEQFPNDFLKGNDDAKLKYALSTLRGSAATYKEAAQQIIDVFSPNPEPDAESKELLSHDEGQVFLKSLREILEDIPSENWMEFNMIGDAFKSACKQSGKVAGLKGKQLWQTVRAGLTGQLHGPELTKLVAIWGRERVLSELERHR